MSRRVLECTKNTTRSALVEVIVYVSVCVGGYEGAVQPNGASKADVIWSIACNIGCLCLFGWFELSVSKCILSIIAPLILNLYEYIRT